MKDNPFKPATREATPIKILVTGPSGSGKTYSAILLAQGLANGGKIALLDTENKRASLYAHLGGFDVLNMEPPYEVQKYIQAIKDAVEAGYEVLIIDSITHEWAGDGGLTSQKESLDARGGNQFANWAPITKQHEAFKAAIVSSPINIIATVRSKQDYVLDKENKPHKIGFEPVQRPGTEYEFMLVLDIAMNHQAGCSKDNTGLFDGKVATITPEHGKVLREWRDSGAPVTYKPPDKLIIIANLQKAAVIRKLEPETVRALGDDHGVKFPPGKMDKKRLYLEVANLNDGETLQAWLKAVEDKPIPANQGDLDLREDEGVA